jgi:hypothetical protein
MALSVMVACGLEFVGEVEMGSMALLVLTACKPAEARSRCKNTDDLGETVGLQNVEKFKGILPIKWIQLK